MCTNTCQYRIVRNESHEVENMRAISHLLCVAACGMPTKSKSTHPIALLRSVIGKTSEDFGALIDLRGSSVRGIENGRVALSSPAAYAISAKFGVTAQSIQQPGEPVALWTGKPYGQTDWEFYDGTLNEAVRHFMKEGNELQRALGCLGRAWFSQYQNPGVRELVTFLNSFAMIQCGADAAPFTADSMKWVKAADLEQFNLGRIILLLLGAATIARHEVSENYTNGQLVSREHRISIERTDGTGNPSPLDFRQKYTADRTSPNSEVTIISSDPESSFDDPSAKTAVEARPVNKAGQPRRAPIQRTSRTKTAEPAGTTR